MDEQIFRKLLAGLRMADSCEAQAARILIEVGEELARGNTAPLERLYTLMDKTTDATAIKVYFLIVAGVVCEVSQTSKAYEELEGFERGWKRGFDKGFSEALKIRHFSGGEHGL
jgi:hypothetical protein